MNVNVKVLSVYFTLVSLSSQKYTECIWKVEDKN